MLEHADHDHEDAAPIDMLESYYAAHGWEHERHDDEIVAMLALSIAATFVFARIRPAAAWLMVPYMVWISFAGVLAFSIGQLNPDAETLAPAPHTSQML